MLAYQLIATVSAKAGKQEDVDMLNSLASAASSFSLLARTSLRTSSRPSPAPTGEVERMRKELEGMRKERRQKDEALKRQAAEGRKKDDEIKKLKEELERREGAMVKQGEESTESKAALSKHEDKETSESDGVLFICNADGDAFAAPFSPSLRVAELCQMCARQWNVVEGSLVMSYGGTILDNGRTLADYNIMDGSYLSATCRLLGG